MRAQANEGGICGNGGKVNIIWVKFLFQICTTNKIFLIPRRLAEQENIKRRKVSGDSTSYNNDSFIESHFVDRSSESAL